MLVKKVEGQDTQREGSSKKEHEIKVISNRYMELRDLKC